MDDPSRPARPPLPTATVDDLLALTTYDFPVHVAGRLVALKLRRLDMFTRFIEDVIPLPILSAAHDLIERLRDAGNGLEGPAAADARSQALKALTEEERRDLREMLWRNAALVSVAPPISLDGAPGTFHVKLLDIETLLRIYHENPPDLSVPSLGGADASSFRGAVGDTSAAAGSVGETVRTEAEQLVASAGGG